jgi:hypothetical protein
MAGRPSIASDYVSVILRAIDKAQNDPAQLRSLVYDVARLSLGKHVLTHYGRLGSAGLNQHVSDLEAAINQIEDRSQKQGELAANGEGVQLVESPPSSSDSNAVAILDSPGDAIFRDAWLDKTPVAVRQASTELYGSSRQVAEVLQPTEIWEPSFGRGPTRNRANSWWAIQISTAVLIGLAIYVVTFVRSDDYPALTQALRGPTSQAASQAPIASNQTPKSSSLSGAKAPDFPLPTVYGVYAMSAGQLFELDQLPMRVPDPRVAISAMISSPSHVTVPNGKLGFVIFRRDLASSAPMEVFVRVIAQVAHEMKFAESGPPATTKVDGQWAVRSKSYEFRVAPVDGNPEMIVLRPEDPQLTLSPGRYALVIAGQGYDFSVDGKITDLAQCLERTNVIDGMVYSECRTLP